MAFAQAYIAKQVVVKDIPNPHPQLQMGIVIPCYLEPSVVATIDSLYQAYLYYPQPLLLIVVVNCSEHDTAEAKAYNRRTYQQLVQKSSSYSEAFGSFRYWLKIYLINMQEQGMPGKLVWMHW